MALTLRDTAANAMVDALTDLIDGGTVEIRSGAKPANPADAATGTLLATLTLPTPSFGAAASRAATVGAVAATTGSATGTAGHFRAKSSGGTAYVDGTVTATGGGGDLELDSVSVVSGESVDITGGTWQIPA
jgi:hypothetical protein